MRGSTSTCPRPVNVAGYYQKNILDGKRHSAADAFLTPVLSRPNLEVRSHCSGDQADDRTRPGRGRGVSAERKARTGARRSRGDPQQRCDRFAKAADAVRHRAGGSPQGPGHSRDRRCCGRRAEPSGSSEAVDPLDRHDGAAGLDRHRGNVHALEPVGAGETRPTSSSTSGAGSRRRIDSSPSPSRWSSPSRGATSGCARRIRWRHRSSAAITCKNRQTSMRW